MNTNYIAPWSTSLLLAVAGSGGLWFAAAKPEDEAQKWPAEQWLALVDAGNYAESWRPRRYFQAPFTSAMGAFCDAARMPLGTFISRKLNAPNTPNQCQAHPTANTSSSNSAHLSRTRRKQSRPSPRCLTRTASGRFLDITSSEQFQRRA